MNKILPIAILVMVLSACYKDKEQELYPNEFIKVNDTTVVTYSKVIQPLIGTNCATGNCHATGAPNIDLASYTTLKAKIDRVKVRAIVEKTMPSSAPLSAENIDKLQKWIDAGALNN